MIPGPITLEPQSSREILGTQVFGKLLTLCDGVFNVLVFDKLRNLFKKVDSVASKLTEQLYMQEIRTVFTMNVDVF